MALPGHMEELRDRIVKSVIAIGVAFVAGIFLAGPLLKRLQIEANAIGGFDVVSPTDPITLYLSMPFVVLLFLLGVAYAFFFAAPRALTFLSGFMSDLFEWSPEGEAVITFFLTLMLGLGLAFQLPVVMFVLAKLGVASPAKMRSFRKYAILILLILSAVITPSTDPFNMAIVFVPLYLLYEAGILVARIFARQPVESPAAS